MKKNTLLIGLLLVSGTLAAQDWPAVQTEARPGSRWWWMGNTVDIPNLTYNIDEYAKAGLGTLEVTPIYGVQGMDDKELKFLSPEWTAMLKHTQAEVPVSIIKRSAGRSAVAAAAYRSGTKLTNEWDGMTHDYTRKGGIVHAEIMLPAHAPPEFADRSILWNSVEQIDRYGCLC